MLDWTWVLFLTLGRLRRTTENVRPSGASYSIQAKGGDSTHSALPNTLVSPTKSHGKLFTPPAPALAPRQHSSTFYHLRTPHPRSSRLRSSFYPNTAASPAHPPDPERIQSRPRAASTRHRHASRPPPPALPAIKRASMALKVRQPLSHGYWRSN